MSERLIEYSPSAEPHHDLVPRVYEPPCVTDHFEATAELAADRAWFWADLPEPVCLSPSEVRLRLEEEAPYLRIDDVPGADEL